MVRPCFLVIDPEHASAVSSRKLVLETAKFNVITAYSCAEALETLERFPRVHALVLNGAMRDDDCYEFLLSAAERFPEVKRVLVGHLREQVSVDSYVESFQPARLLEELRSLFPEEATFIDAQEARLND